MAQTKATAKEKPDALVCFCGGLIMLVAYRMIIGTLGLIDGALTIFALLGVITTLPFIDD